jgi:DNA-binding NarL/FixJ family response regulator
MIRGSDCLLPNTVERATRCSSSDCSITTELRPRLIAVDDQESILRKVSEIVAREFEIVATLNDGAEVAAIVAQSRPDIVLLDLCMIEVNGFTAAREIRRRCLPVRIVFLSVQEDQDFVDAAVALNASYVLKRRMHVDLLTALRDALAGKLFTSVVL